MQFIMGDILGFGVVGFMYYNTTGYLISRIIFFGTIALAIVGVITVLSFVFGGGFKFKRKTKKSKSASPLEHSQAEKDWLKTGRM